MSNLYLNAYFGVCVGGMFFKEGDKVKISGRLHFSDTPCEVEGFIIQMFPSKNQIFIGDDGGFMYVFNISRVNSIEHIKEDE